MKLEHFFELLGVSENDSVFIDFLSSFNDEYKKEYLEFSDTTYYSFFSKGIEVGITNNKISYIHFFIIPSGDYAECKLEFNLKSMQLLEQGGEKEFLGKHINKWELFKYDIENNIRLEYNSQGVISMVSIIHK